MMAGVPFLFALLSLMRQLQCCSARPTVLQEQSIGYYKSFGGGMYVGFETLLSLAGFYEEDEVAGSIRSPDAKLHTQAVDKEDQTQIKVVGLGLGRTGTTSVVMALEILGYTVVHDDEQTELADLYHFLIDEDSDDDDEEEDDDEDYDEGYDEFHDILGLRGYNATFKTAGLEWVVRHDEVKAILTVRDTPDKYVDSWMVAAPFLDIVKMLPFRWMTTAAALTPSLENEYRRETTGNNPAEWLNRTVLKDNFVKYNEMVRARVPAARLLTFNVKQGWEPLCAFLGHPIPEGIPFPHVHTRAKLEGEMFFLRVITWIWPSIFLVPLPVFWVLVHLFFKFVAPENRRKSKAD